MALINEIQIGSSAKYNGMTVFRKYNAELGFIPHYRFKNDNELSLDSKIIVNYIEYYKNSDGEEIEKLREYKNYVVANLPATTKVIQVVVTPAVYYTAGEVITPAIFEDDVETFPAVLAVGGELKTPAVMGNETVEDKPAWYAANGWFMSVARTPVQAQVGIMDGIEATLAGMPVGVPNGYVLQRPL